MEDVLEWYAEPYDSSRPVVCFDECSKELHGQVAEPIPDGVELLGVDPEVLPREGQAERHALVGQAVEVRPRPAAVALSASAAGRPVTFSITRPSRTYSEFE